MFPIAEYISKSTPFSNRWVANEYHKGINHYIFFIPALFSLSQRFKMPVFLYPGNSHFSGPYFSMYSLNF